MHYFRDYHIVTLIIVYKMSCFMVRVTGKYRSTLWITCTAELWLGMADPENKSTSKARRQQPGIRMLAYDLKLQFTVKTKWEVRMRRLTCSSATFRKGEWKASLWGKLCRRMLGFGDALVRQLSKVSSYIYIVGCDSSLKPRKQMLFLLIVSTCYLVASPTFLQELVFVH